MAALIRYVRTDSTAGGDGTEDRTDGATRAYASLSAADAAEAADLTDGGGDTLEIRCSVGGGSAADTTSAVFGSGWVTSATSYVTIKPVASNVNTTGIFDTALYRLDVTAGYTGNIRVQSPCNHVNIEQIQSTVSGFQTALYLQGTGVAKAERCICKGTGAGANSRGIRHGASSGEFIVVNNIVFDMISVGIHNDTFQNTGERTYYNNTVDNCSTGLQIASGSATSRAFNNLLTNNTTDYSSAASATSDNNVTSDATGPDTGHTSKTVTYTDAANDDFSTSDADIVDLGTDLSADATYAFSVDIIGTSRPASNWDIGAYEAAAAAGNTITANQTEAGDSQSASIVSLIDITANQTEAGDTTVATLQAIAQISTNQVEAGDTQVATIVNVIKLSINQQEAGDTQTSTIVSIAKLTANQTEVGDTQVASLVENLIIAAISFIHDISLGIRIGL